MRIILDPDSLDSYQTFLKIKALPTYRFIGRTAIIPDEYAERIGVEPIATSGEDTYEPLPSLFDYQEAITRLAIQKRKFCVFADCVAAGTLIDTEHGLIPIESITRPIRVWCRSHSGARSLSWASPSWINGFGRLYEFRCVSGRRVTATMGHRFMTDRGWQRGDELKIGDRLLVSDVSRPLSILECDQLTPISSGQNYERTVSDLTADYSACHNHNDERLRSDADSDQWNAPSQADAHERSQQQWRMDGLACESTHSHQHQYNGRLSKRDCDRRDGTTVATELSPPLSSDHIRIVESSHTSGQVPVDTIPEQQACEFPSSAIRQSAVDQFEPLQFSYETLAAIHYIRDDVFYDLEIPEFENYFAGGFVSHNCGLGKTLIFLEFAKHVLGQIGDRQCVLIVSPLMVIKQTLAECKRFYGDSLQIEQVRAAGLKEWLQRDTGCVTSDVGRIGITNYESLTDDIRRGRLGCLICDESSIFKSHYGKWGTKCLELGKGLNWKMACTGTPAPNDRIEYANHAVFMDAYPTVNSFLARFFVNRGQVDNRWELKAHAVRPFYRALSHWSIFLTNPATYGWHDHSEPLPPIVVHKHHVDMTPEQQNLVYHHTGSLFADRIGGITSRSVLSQIAKGNYKGQYIPTNKPGFIRTLVEGWPDESTIIWCLYNREQETLEREFPEAGSLKGSTPYELREAIIDDFKAGRRKIIISKPKILGFGLNLEVCTRQVFSGLMDSYESFYQAVKRSNRIGSTRPLNVHIPLTDVEYPMVATVMAKADRVQADTEEQEKLFRDAC